MKKYFVGVALAIVGLFLIWKSGIVSMGPLPAPATRRILAQFKNHPLREQLIKRMQIPSKRLQGHTRAVNSVAYSPDGSQLASGSSDETIILWNVANSTVERTLQGQQGHTEEVTSVAYSPDGRQLASGSDDETIILWNVANGTVERRLQGPDWVTSVAYSPDGRQLASGSGDETVILWNVANGTVERRLQGPDWVTSVAYSPDGNWLASGSADETVILWNVANGTEEKRLQGHAEEVSSVAYSPDGNWLASGSEDGTVILWNVANGTVERRLQGQQGHTRWVKSVAYSPDGSQLAVGSDDKTVILWDLNPINQVNQWFNKGLPVADSFEMAVGDKRRTIKTNPLLIVGVLNGISDAIRNRIKFIATPMDLAYLQKLIFPQLPQAAVNVLKQHVAVEKRKVRRRRTRKK